MGQKYGRGGALAPSMKLCWCGGSLGMHTRFLSVYWCVVGGEYELGVYTDGGYIVVYAGSVRSCWW